MSKQEKSLFSAHLYGKEVPRAQNHKYAAQRQVLGRPGRGQKRTLPNPGTRWTLGGKSTGLEQLVLSGKTLADCLAINGNCKKKGAPAGILVCGDKKAAEI